MQNTISMDPNDAGNASVSVIEVMILFVIGKKELNVY